MKIIPKDYVETKAPIRETFDDDVKAELLLKVKELLTEPMAFGDIVNMLQYYYVYGNKPEIVAGVPQTTGSNIPTKAGWTSRHFTSSQLKEVVQELYNDSIKVEEDKK